MKRIRLRGGEAIKASHAEEMRSICLEYLTLVLRDARGGDGTFDAVMSEVDAIIRVLMRSHESDDDDGVRESACDLLCTLSSLGEDGYVQKRIACVLVESLDKKAAPSVSQDALKAALMLMDREELGAGDVILEREVVECVMHCLARSIDDFGDDDSVMRVGTLIEANWKSELRVLLMLHFFVLMNNGKTRKLRSWSVVSWQSIEMQY